jgi:hypothetical protein
MLVILVGIVFIKKFTAPVNLSVWRCVVIILCEWFWVVPFGEIIAQYIYAPGLSWILKFSISAGIGALFGIGSALYFPNYPPWKALFAGILGGIIGSIPVIIAVEYFVSEDYFGFIFLEPNLTRIVSLMGIWAFLCGFTISFVEEASRRAWLTVVWKTGKKTSVALGKRPISFGSAKEALIRLPRYSFEQKGLGISAVFTMEYDGKVFVRDSTTGALEELVNGSRVDLRAADVVVHIARGKTP